MFPYKDAGGAGDLPHLRNALARIPQSDRIDGATKRRLLARGRKILSDQQKEAEGLLDRIARVVKEWFAGPEDDSNALHIVGTDFGMPRSISFFRC